VVGRDPICGEAIDPRDDCFHCFRIEREDKLKGLFDRAFLPGRTFSTRDTNWLGLPAPMLGGRTGRVIVTSDTPGWFLHWVYRNAMLRQLRDQILGFVGIRPARITRFSGASHPKAGVVERWTQKMREIGALAA
jgi:putative NADPH-quinone reductase